VVISFSRFAVTMYLEDLLGNAMRGVGGIILLLPISVVSYSRILVGEV